MTTGEFGILVNESKTKTRIDKQTESEASATARWELLASTDELLKRPDFKLHIKLSSVTESLSCSKQHRHTLKLVHRINKIKGTS